MNLFTSNSQVSLIVQYKKVKKINIRVTWDGKVVVSVPAGMNYETFKRVLERRINWISKKLEEIEIEKKLLPSSREFIDGKILWFLGESITLKVMNNNNKEDEISLKDRELVVGIPENDIDRVKQMVMKWLQDQAFKVVSEKIEKFAKALGVKPKNVELRDWKRKWGLCNTSEGILRFNWRLIQLPESLIEYVVAHELVHLRYPKHNSKFQALVSEIMPDWRVKHKELKKWIGALIW